MVSRVVEAANSTDRGDIARLHELFKRTHETFLDRYKQYAGIDELLKGRYDCLTATSLFADVLGKAGFSFSIFETNYHIFLIVRTAEGNVLLESTDRFNGFVKGRRKINDRIATYRQSLPSSTFSTNAYAYRFDMYKEVAPGQLPGLLYFNQAVKAYNERNWLECAQKLACANDRYPSRRVSELVTVLLATVSVGPIADEEKDAVMKELKGLESYPGIPIASR